MINNYHILKLGGNITMAQNDEKKNNVLLENLAIITTPENVQKYILGTKKDGNPRALYDVIRDYTKPGKKKKKKHKKNKNHDDLTSYSLYVTTKKKGKKKGKKKKNKHWHI